MAFWFLVLEAVGARDKYQSNVIQLLRSMSSFDREFANEKPTVLFDNRWYRDPNQAIRNIPPRVPSDIEHLQADDVAGEATLASPGWRDGTEKVSYFENDILKGILFEMGLPPLKLGQTSQAPYRTSYPTEVWTANKEIFTFCANLAWLAFRCKCYELASRKIGSTYMPHPLRSNIAGFSMATDGLEAADDAHQIAYAKAYVDVLKQVRDESAEKAKILGRAVFQPLTWSPLLPHVARKAGGADHVVNAAYELRDTLGARNLRRTISRLDQSVQRGNLKSALHFCEEIQTLGAALRSDLGIFEPSPKLTVSFAGFGNAEVPAGAVPKFLKRKRYPFKARFTLMRSVFDDLMTISSLGSVYEMICPLGAKSTPSSDPATSDKPHSSQGE
jgi:hypothetical protein